MNSSPTSIAVYGEALIDDFGDQQVLGGAPFNVARALAAFGLMPTMITSVGDDANGALIRAEFAHFAMDARGLQADPSAPTGRVMVERGAGEHRFVILPDQAYDRIAAAPALAALACARPATIYFGTLAQRGAASRATLEALLAASDASRYLDLNLRDGQVDALCIERSLQLADIVKVNEDELQGLLRRFGRPEQLGQDIGSAATAAACGALLQRFELDGLVVTLGAQGVAYFGADGAILRERLGATRTALVDTVGAGDAFSAVFLLGRALDWPLALTLSRANLFAGAICGVRGAVPADPGFYRPWIAAWLAGATAAPAGALQ